MYKILRKSDIELMLNEGEKNYAADTSGVNDTPGKIIANTEREHPDATSVTVTSKEIDGNPSTQVPTVKTGKDPVSLANAQKMARQFQSQGVDANFQFKVKEGVKRSGELIENAIKFSKSELSEFLRS